MKIAIGADHAGFKMKEFLKSYLQTKGFEIKDFGCYSEHRADYPDYGHPVATAVAQRHNESMVRRAGKPRCVYIQPLHE